MYQAHLRFQRGFLFLMVFYKESITILSYTYFASASQMLLSHKVYLLKVYMTIVISLITKWFGFFRGTIAKPHIMYDSILHAVI